MGGVADPNITCTSPTSNLVVLRQRMYASVFSFKFHFSFSFSYSFGQGRLLHINDGANAPWKK